MPFVNTKLWPTGSLALVGVLAALVLVAFSFAGSQSAPSSPLAPLAESGAAIQARLSEAYGRLPLSFEANQGQADPEVEFLSRGSGYTLFLTSGEAVLSLSQPDANAVLRMQLVGANLAPQVVGLGDLPGKVNYFIGNDPQGWQTNIPTHSRVQYQNVYPGVDLVYYGNQGQLEYDLVVAPGGDPNAIRLRFDGAEKISLDADGNLIVQVSGGEVIQRAPVIYQEIDGAKQKISGGYVLQGEDQVGFEVAAYDASRPLFIDPVLVYSSYLGGSDRDLGHAIALDGAGNAYVAGETLSDNFPTASLQSTRAGNIDAFVTKVSADGSTIIYSTYLGGGSGDVAEGIAVDATGNAYVTGSASSDFPTTVGSFDTTYDSPTDAFVSKLNPAGDALVYSTFLGGSKNDATYGIAVVGDNAYVAGKTDSVDFPATGFQGALAGESDAFVTKFNAAGSALEYSSYLGGSKTDGGYDIAVDSGGNAYVTGETRSEDFPTTVGSYQPGFGGGAQDVFVTKVNAAGDATAYSTYLGSTRSDVGFGIAVDISGHAYVTGEAGFDDFPTTSGAFQTSRGGTAGDVDAFVTRLTAAGDALICSSFLGGSNKEHGAGIAVSSDSMRSAYLTGWTSSSDFPTVSPISGGDVYQDGDVYVTRVNTEGCAVVHSSFLGGSESDRTGGDAGDPDGNPIAVDSAGCAYVTGRTPSTDFPTVSPFQAAHGGGDNDAFIAKICDDMAATPTPTSTATPTPTATPTTKPAIVDQLASCAGTVAAVYGLQPPATFLRHFPDRLDISNLDELTVGDGYFFLLTGACQLTFEDYAISLDAGWAWLAWDTPGSATDPPTTEGSPIADQIAACVDDIVTIYGADPATGAVQRYIGGRPEISNLSRLLQGYGYLIQSTAACSLPQDGITNDLVTGFNFIGWIEPSVSEGSGPIAQWKFDGNALDATGNGHDATVLGGAEYMGGAAEMDGTDDAFQVANAPDLNPADAITVAAWWNAVDFIGAGNNGLVDKGFTSHTAPFYQYHLGVTGSGWPGGSHFDFLVALDGTSVGTGGTDWTPGQLYHLVGTYDGSEVRLYVNGVLAASQAASGSMTDYGKDLFIGRYTNLQDEGVHFLPGAIDEVAIWDRALSADEIAALYSVGPR